MVVWHFLNDNKKVEVLKSRFLLPPIVRYSYPHKCCFWHTSPFKQVTLWTMHADDNCISSLPVLLAPLALHSTTKCKSLSFPNLCISLPQMQNFENSMNKLAIFMQAPFVVIATS
ncbi:hypothetical protein CEXT_656141 [Caerostris extrusa]|uniref:Uncharacterized protein n=1 Tax=Caerostris extrusa TaxID=172846 RepID=A0AAV4SCF2_CAEEX|nr:hypothetical protein CEXT_656141 [Caerostris extrusa]